MSTMSIRMYNVGFGDSFLIMLPNGKKILVDAGFHSQGKGKFSAKELAEQIVADVTNEDGVARIDVVIATHRHQDHVYAFNSDIWEQVEVGEVWLPWVEDRTNERATKLWKKQQGFALSLTAALSSFALSPADRESVEFMLWNAGVEGLPGFAAVAGWSNKRALDCLHEGFARRDRQRPRFLPSTQKFPELFKTPLLPGVSVHVLGPSRDPEKIRELDPEGDGETYRALKLRAISHENGPQSLRAEAPFGRQWQVNDLEGTGALLDADEIERLNALSESADALAAAKKIDNIINSTSLVLVLEIGKARLLLPGDAEWGTWSLILDNDDATQLLKGCTFFKVGHHGSHNATSPRLVEKVLPRNIPAMMSTQEGPGTYRSNIPLHDLLDSLKSRGLKCARSDKLGAKLPENFKRGPQGKWIDVTINC